MNDIIVDFRGQSGLGSIGLGGFEWGNPRAVDVMFSMRFGFVLAKITFPGFRFPDRDYYDRHLVFDNAIPIGAATQRERFEALSRTIRDILTQRWISTAETYDRRNPKQVHYLSPPE